MASHSPSARHAAARNIILLWLGGAIAIAGIGILVTYHGLRDQSMQLAAAAPLMSKRNATKPVRSPLIPEKLADAAKSAITTVTDSSADVARAHRSAIQEAKAADETSATD